jgi:hypothetical protein
MPAAARPAAAGGTAYGGTTAQDFPVVIEMSRTGRKVVDARIGIRLPCTAGGRIAIPDGYEDLVVNRRKRRFSSSFGPETDRNDDGTSTDFQGRVSGTFNRSRTRVTGTWALKVTDHDASGAVTDTCDSGTVSWKAKQ